MCLEEKFHGNLVLNCKVIARERGGVCEGRVLRATGKGMEGILTIVILF